MRYDVTECQEIYRVKLLTLDHNPSEYLLIQVRLFSFSVCLVGEKEKWEGGKLFYLVEKKSGRIENIVYINWLLYPCYIIGKR